MPPTGVKALHETPAARATGSSGVRSPARTMAVNGELLLITMSFHRSGSVCRECCRARPVYSALAYCLPEQFVGVQQSTVHEAFA